MMKRFSIVPALALLILSALSGCGSDSKESGLTPTDLSAATYVGSDRCARCHSDIYATFVKTGHPYKYQHTGGATPGAYGIPGLFTTPLLTGISTSTLNGLRVDNGSGLLAWSAINYTVGGFGWKIRWGIRDYQQDSQSPWVNDTGYVWGGSQAQFNILTNTVSAYESGNNKKYECAICHNTNGIVSTAGYSCETDGGTNVAPARPQPWAKNPGMGPDAATRGGYFSSWSLDGIQCEECHGPGSVHIASPYRTGSIVRNKTIFGTVEICAKCHIRSINTNDQGGECGGDSNPAILTNGAVGNVAGGGQWIQHHEAYNEMVGYNGDGAHASLKCTTCHDPHKRTIRVIESVRATLGITDNHLPAETRGAVKVSCQSCHPGYEQAKTAAMEIAHRNMTCIDCHMAEAKRTATNSPTTGWGRKADMKTHIVRINPAGGTVIHRTNADNKTIAENFITPSYACGKCHDVNINPGTGMPMTLVEAQAAAAGYHTP